MSAGSSTGKELARIDGELRTFWSQPPPPGEMPKARACTMNLVVVASSPKLAEAWVPIVDDVLLGVPARAIVVGLDPDGNDSLEGGATAVCTPAAGGEQVVCSERVTLTARGALCARLASCVDALAVTDVPTTLVWLGRVHADDPAFAPLAASASRIVFDSSVGSLASLAHVVYWARARAPSERPGVADLTWTRIAPWQELCARLFDEPRVRHLASRVTRVTLAQASQSGVGLAPEGTMLLGWLATSLGWRAASLAGKLRLLRPDEAPVNVQLGTRPASVPPGSLVALRVEAGAGDLSLVGEVEREGEPSTEAMATWRLAVSSGGQTSRLEQRVQLRGSDPARLLERTLHRPPHDAALLEAVAWADELRGEELACS